MSLNVSFHTQELEKIPVPLIFGVQMIECIVQDQDFLYLELIPDISYAKKCNGECVGEDVKFVYAAQVYCECQDRKAVASCPFHRCCNCCTAANAEGLDNNGQLAICKYCSRTIRR